MLGGLLPLPLPGPSGLQAVKLETKHRAPTRKTFLNTSICIIILYTPRVYLAGDYTIGLLFVKLATVIVYYAQVMKSGIVAIVGRTNAGKSTLINNLLGQKVAITSPKPRTTHFPIRAVYEDERGQIVFIDTPGFYRRLDSDEVSVIVYLIDQSRYRGHEENQIIGIVRSFSNTPKILVFNKIDLKKPSFRAQYKFLESEVDAVMEISALKAKNLKGLIETIFSFLKEGKPIVAKADLVSPLINVDSKNFLAELIREKVYLSTGDEVPYHTSAVVEEVTHRKKKKILYIKAKVLVDQERYKKILIGKEGRKIKSIGIKARKELELATGKQVFLDLRVEEK